MAEKSLKIVYTGDASQLQRTMGQIAGQSDTLGAKIKRLGSTFGFAFGGVAVIAAFKNIVDQYTEFLQVNTQTQAALKSTGGAAGVTQTHVQELSATLGKLTAQDGEVVQGMENVLLTFTKVKDSVGQGNDIFDRASLAVENLSARMGKDLTSSAVLVGKALNDPIKGLTALTRVGVLFTDQQRKQIAAMMKSHDILGAQKVVLGELTKEFGGSAKAAGDAASPFTKLKLIWNDLAQKAGPGVVAVLNGIATVIGAIASSPDLGQMVITIGAIVVAFKAAAVAAEIFGTSLAVWLPEIAIVSLAVAGLTAVLKKSNMFVEQMNPTLTALAEAYGSMRVHVDAAGVSVKNFANKTSEGLKTFTKETITAMTLTMTSLDSVKRGFDLTSAAAVRGSGIIADKQRTISADIRKLDELKIGDGLKAQLLSLGPDMVDAFIRGNAGQRQKILNNLKIYNEAVKTTNANVKKIAGTGGEETGRALDDGVVRGIVDRSPQMEAAARAAVQRAINGAKDQAGVHSPSTVMAAMGRDLIQGIVNGMKDRASELEKAFNTVSNHLDKLQARAKAFKDSIKSGFSSLGDLGGLVSGMFGQTDAEGNPIAVTAASTSASIASQVAQAKQLAQDLQAAAAAGLSKNLLAQFASQGATAIPGLEELLANPALIAQLNAASKQIAAAASQTATALDANIGAAIERTRAKLQDMAQNIQAFIDHLRGQIAGAGDQLAQAIRSIADEIRTALQAGNANLGLAGTGGGGGGGGGGGAGAGGGVTHVYNFPHYLGNERDLVTTLQQAAQRIKGRNGSSGFA